MVNGVRASFRIWSNLAKADGPLLRALQRVGQDRQYFRQVGPPCQQTTSHGHYFTAHYWRLTSLTTPDLIKGLENLKVAEKIISQITVSCLYIGRTCLSPKAAANWLKNILKFVSAIFLFNSRPLSSDLDLISYIGNTLIWSSSMIIKNDSYIICKTIR